MERLAEGLWESGQTLSLLGIKLPRRMTVVRLEDGGLWLHSVNRLTDERKRALDALGPVKHLVLPNCFHHFFVEDYLTAYPEARVWAAPGLREKLGTKRPGLTIHEVLSDQAPEAWAGQLDQLVAQGMPKINEVMFFHRASKTLLLTDTVFHVNGGVPLWTRTFYRLNGCWQRLGPSRLFRSFVTDRAAVGRSVAKALEWEPERVLMAHGDVVDVDATPRVRKAFAGW